MYMYLFTVLIKVCPTEVPGGYLEELHLIIDYIGHRSLWCVD